MQVHMNTCLPYSTLFLTPPPTPGPFLMLKSQTTASAVVVVVATQRASDGSEPAHHGAFNIIYLLT